MTTELKYSSILGTKINITDMNKTVSYIEHHLEELKGHYICVSNVHTTVTAYRDEEYREVQNNAAMNIPDGKPLSIVQKHSGYKDAGRVPGPDLMPEIFRISETKGYRHYFYGSRQDTLDALHEKLMEQYPRLKIVGMYSPPFRPMSEKEDLDAIENINAVSPDFLWIGLGAPKQEKWMAAHDGKVCGVMIGVGAGFDFHAGTIRRAPLWMQEFCMEWLFRIGQDPKRLLPRYLDTNFSFVFYLFRELLKGEKNIDKKHINETINSNINKSIFKGKNGRPLRIAMIGHKRIPSREGGVEIVVDELSSRMVKLGYEVHAYNRYGRHTAGKKFDQRRGKYYNGIRLITIPTPKASSLNAIVYSFFAAIRALFGRYDVLHFHAEGPCTMLWIPKLFGIRVVATIHGLDWQRSKWGNFATKVLQFGEKSAVKYSDELIVLSKNMQDYFFEKYKRETVFIPNGINKPEIKPADMIYRQYGLEKDGYILFLARIVPEKGLHYLIEAFSQVKTEKKLVIAGGNSNSHDYMEQIKEMASKDQRIIMTDFVHGQCLEELYSNAYIFVLPSDVEGMALSLLEAMSYGNCCLVSDIEENKEVIGEYAKTFKKGNVSDLEKNITELINAPDIVSSYQKISRNYICDKYNWDKVVNDTLNLYSTE
ncbi:WecB/TagA/CpsF family glycosyltransferase [Eisenbergiella tayi]|uniref:Putative N-acetylmannosaminyltransferase n=1 Tax=Eisenbergiella tayi TaxID=1432052 RepID=A0A1E3AXD8_9FIRM|nr:WecB/TagA/CpsF family glycosyltransferase [Eisenbergiella tayi]ODM13380.1 putative N-acetylmannosaminyltransferase [Eisenbergiella tayi]